MLIVRLLQKVGKEIMKRCEIHINVDRVFSGFIISTKKNIDQSIKYAYIIIQYLAEKITIFTLGWGSRTNNQLH